MGKVIHLGSRSRRRSAGARPGPRRIGRDMFAVIAAGCLIGLAMAWTRVDLADGRSVISALWSGLHQLAAVGDGDDEIPVSSISRDPAPKSRSSPERLESRAYSVCGTLGASRAFCVVDGDTFRADGELVRVSDIDAPETHPPRCAYEADLGDRATNRLADLLSEGPFTLVRVDRDRDRYGRKLRVVIRDGRSIGRVLVSEGLARPWRGKRQPWCRGASSVG